MVICIIIIYWDRDSQMKMNPSTSLVEGQSVKYKLSNINNVKVDSKELLLIRVKHFSKSLFQVVY